MPINDDDDTRTYIVVVNHEEQYSLWLADKQPIPLGWTQVGKPGTKAECLTLVEQVWTDMRPLSLRRQAESTAQA